MTLGMNSNNISFAHTAAPNALTKQEGPHQLPKSHTHKRFAPLCVHAGIPEFCFPQDGKGTFIINKKHYLL